MTALLVIRAEVHDLSDREAFDGWYRDVQLPRAARAFKAVRARRAWSRTSPSTHLAYYEFETVALAEAALQSPEAEAVVAGFDGTWGQRATKTLSIEEVVQSI